MSEFFGWLIELVCLCWPRDNDREEQRRVIGCFFIALVIIGIVVLLVVVF